MSEKPTNGNKATQIVPAYESMLVSISNGLAAKFLENNIERGMTLEIPSLGIKIGKPQDMEIEPQEPS